MHAPQTATWADQLHGLVGRVADHTGHLPVEVSDVLDALGAAAGRPELTRAASERLEVLAQDVVAAGGPGSWHARLWRELADAAADLHTLSADRARDLDDCGDVQAHLDYLEAALQVPDHRVAAFRCAVEDHPPAQALTQVLAAMPRLTIDGLASICRCLHRAAHDVAALTASRPTAAGVPAAWDGLADPVPTNATPEEATAGLRAALLALRWHAEQITLHASDARSQALWDRVIDTASVAIEIIDDDLALRPEPLGRDPHTGITYLQRAATVPPALLDDWIQLAARLGPDDAYRRLIAR